MLAIGKQVWQNELATREGTAPEGRAQGNATNASAEATPARYAHSDKSMEQD